MTFKTQSGDASGVPEGVRARRELRKGMRGTDVVEWQQQLMRDGYSLSPYGADGKFGTVTHQATTLWQSARGLPATGIVDASTRAAAARGEVSPPTRWAPPAAPKEGEAMCIAVDPRVDQNHRPGELPCPRNPPPPDGWEYWRGKTPEGGDELALDLAFSPAKYPMGTFVQTHLEARLFGARVEWHDTEGATGKTGCFRGASLMVPHTVAHPSRLSYGVDSLRPVVSKAKGRTLTQLALGDLGGQVPQFWGRYISRPGHSDYSPTQEAAALSGLGIRVLPIARQTRRVGGDAAMGRADAQNNVLALKEVFGADTLKARRDRLYVFLDVEAGTPLSEAYYVAWATELSGTDVLLGPCLYMPSYPNNRDSWAALERALAHGAECDGLWIAWYLRSPGAPFEMPPSWDTRKMAQPTRVPVFAWQYLGDVHDHALDYSVMNPAIDLDVDLLPHLILPTIAGMPH